MKKVIIVLAVIMLFGLNVKALSVERTIPVEIKNKELKEVVSIVDEISNKDNVQHVIYEIKNNKTVLFISVKDQGKFEETEKVIYGIEGLEKYNSEIKNDGCQCDKSNCSLSDDDINSMVKTNYILYATEIILLILIVIIVVLLLKKRKSKEDK